jgi:TonB family protein
LRPALLLLALLIVGRTAMAQSAPESGGAPTEGATAPPRTIVPPRLVTFVPAPFPPGELAAGRGAAVDLQISIDASGHVVAVTVIGSATPAFDEAAVAAARQFVFAPATLDGAPIPVKITYRTRFTLTEKLVKKASADFAGTVRDRLSKRPIANVRIALGTGQQTVTDEQGHFALLDVPPGEHGVTLSGEAIATVVTSETFEAGKRLDATYDIDEKKARAAGEDDDEQIVVSAVRLKKHIVSTEVAAAQAQRIPGTHGDVL